MNAHDWQHAGAAQEESTSTGSSRAGAGPTTRVIPGRPSGELPPAAPTEVQEALAVQLQESAATRRAFESDPFGLGSMQLDADRTAAARGGGGASAAIQRQAAARASHAAGPELQVPKKIEFDDLEVGQRQRRETILWNTGPTEARVTHAELAIDEHQKQFQVRELPDRIMLTSSPVAARSGEIAIDFVPQGEGWRTDTLRLTVKALGADGRERVFAIVLAGRGHLPGQPTHAAKQAREQDEKRRADDHDDDEKHEVSRKARTRRNEQDPRVAPSGRLTAFNARLDDIRDDIRTIDGKRTEGINVVQEEAKAYVRKPPPPTPSTWDYLREGAALALTFASYGLAQGLAAAIIPDGRPSGGPVGMGVGIGDDGQREAKKPTAYRKGIQKSVEKALGKGMEWGINRTVRPGAGGSGGEEAPSGSTLSGDPTVAFFSSQRVALGDSNRARIHELTAMGPELVDQLHEDGDYQEVLAVLDAVRTSLGQVAGTPAVEQQSSATAAQWLSFVSKRSGETHKASAAEGAIAAGTPHADQVSDLRPLDARSGVIEISFSADLKEPGDPVRIVGVRVLGVAHDLAERIRKMKPLEAQVPMRAVARDLSYGGQAIADPALAVARNEVGEIDVSAGKPGDLPDTNQQARYLAAKHAPERQSQRQEADVKAGGRRVVEQEIVAQWESVLGVVHTGTTVHKTRVETDDDSKHKV